MRGSIQIGQEGIHRRLVGGQNLGIANRTEQLPLVLVAEHSSAAGFKKRIRPVQRIGACGDCGTKRVGLGLRRVCRGRLTSLTSILQPCALIERRRAQRQLDRDPRPAPRGTIEREPPTERLDPVDQPDYARPGARLGANRDAREYSVGPDSGLIISRRIHITRKVPETAPFASSGTLDDL